MIIDDWEMLGFEGVVIVVAVLLDCLVHMIFVSSGELLFERSLVKGGVCWCHLGNMGEGRGGFPLGLGVDGLKGLFRKGRRAVF